MKINPDFVVFITMIGSAIIGFAFGRFERKDSYVKGYKRGKEIGEIVGRMDTEREYAFQELAANESK